MAATCFFAGGEQKIIVFVITCSKYHTLTFEWPVVFMCLLFQNRFVWFLLINKNLISAEWSFLTITPSIFLDIFPAKVEWDMHPFQLTFFPFFTESSNVSHRCSAEFHLRAVKALLIHIIFTFSKNRIHTMSS